jgi:hypothetical protein
MTRRRRQPQNAGTRAGFRVESFVRPFIAFKSVMEPHVLEWLAELGIL